MPNTKKETKPRNPLVARIVCPIVMVICIGIMIAANIIINYYSLILNRFFAGDNVNVSADNSVFKTADLAVQGAAADSMVLLENKDDYLPRKDLEKVNLFGWGSTEYGFLLTGGGSGGTTITDSKDIKVDLDDAFKSEGISVNPDLYRAYCDFSSFDADFRSGGSTNAYVEEGLLNPGSDFYSAERMTSAKQYSDVAVAVISRWGAENVNESKSAELKDLTNYKNGTYLELTAEEKAMFDALEEYDFNVIVVLNVCNNMELGFVKKYDSIKACIHAGIPGQSGAVAIPQIITGKVNPSGRTSDTLPYDYQNFNPTYHNAAQTSGHLVYQEGIYFGYKWYETANAESMFSEVNNDYGTGYDGIVQYPFGHGLSYSDFSWSTPVWQDVTDASSPKDANTLAENSVINVKVTVTNNGPLPGKDVVQLYGHTDYINGQIEKPEIVLLDFAKTEELAVGESEEVTLSFTTYDLASYDAYDKNNNNHYGYELDSGNIKVSIRHNVHSVEEANEKQLNTANIKYEKDPVTGNAVVNRFTGNSAYAGVPIDGSTAYTDRGTGDNAIKTSFEYLSRKGKFANYSGVRALGTPLDTAQVNKAVDYVYDGYKDKAAEAESYSYGSDVGLYLVQTESGSKASIDQLTGADTSVKLEYNKPVMEELLKNEDETWALFLDQLTQDEIKHIIGQAGFTTAAVASVGKPRCDDKDGPAGFNNNVTSPGKSSPYTLYPSESLLGCSWSKKTAYSIGEAQGLIGSEFGINGWYGPGVNLHRSVYDARNYEYYSEDAVLSGMLAAETIKGAKDNNLYCYLKHMAVSEAGINPKEVNTWLTEQALRELYLRPFEIGVKKGGANAIMSAFNRVGAVLSAYNHAMLTDILRNEWGFKGSVITDWYTGSGYAGSHTKGVLAGNDLWLCGTTAQDANIDLNNPEIAYAARQSVKGILYTYIETNMTSSGVKINPEASSALFAFLWTIINVVLGIGIALCLFFLLMSFKPINNAVRNFFARIFRRKRPATEAAGADGGSVNADTTDGAAGSAEPEHEDGGADEESAEQPETPPADVADESPSSEAEPEKAEEPEAAAEPEKEETAKTSEKSEEPQGPDKTETAEERKEPDEAPSESQPETEAEKEPAAKKPTSKASGTKSAAKKPTAKSTTKKPPAKKM